MQEQVEYIRELTLTHLVDAPRKRVWEAWTRPEAAIYLNGMEATWTGEPDNPVDLPVAS